MNKLEKIISGSVNYLKSIVTNDEFLKYRSFYGDSFTFCLLERDNKSNESVSDKLLQRFRSLDKTDSQFHFEFNNYAFLDTFSSNDKVLDEILPLKFKNTPCTNWSLLRACTKLKLDSTYLNAIEEAKLKIRSVQDESGLIIDDPGVKSFQYHCFSAAMIGEIYQITKDEFFLKSFKSAVCFIRNFILPNGKALHIGRGQEQTFGYGALVYILALSHELQNDDKYLNDIQKVLNLLEAEQREDGSFPLVLGANEPHPAYLVSMNDEQYCGWYPYNNFYDYLPFMTYFLSKSNSLLAKLKSTKFDNSLEKQIEYRDSNFIKVVKEKYIAIISKPGGYWSNDQVTPLVFSKGECLTPVYGGEQFQESLYKEKDLGTPYLRGSRFTLRFKSKSFFIKNSLIVIGPLGIFIRSYKFNEDEILMKDRSFSLFPLRNSIAECIGDSELIQFSFSRKPISESLSYSSTGRIKLSTMPCWIQTRIKIK